jgi:NitT/TauT family transport system permease protein
VILAELYVSSNGIGSYTQIFAQTFHPAALYSLIAALAIMAIAINAAVGMIERRFTRWVHA